MSFTSDASPIPVLVNSAAAVDNFEVARCLLEAGASTEAMQAGTLNRALHLAAFQGSYSVLAILLQASRISICVTCSAPKNKQSIFFATFNVLCDDVVFNAVPVVLFLRSLLSG